MIIVFDLSRNQCNVSAHRCVMFGGSDTGHGIVLITVSTPGRRYMLVRLSGTPVCATRSDFWRFLAIFFVNFAYKQATSHIPTGLELGDLKPNKFLLDSAILVNLRSY